MHDQTERTCPGRGCSTPLRNEYLCRRCTTRAERAITDLPALAAELEKTIARQSTAVQSGDHSGAGKSTLPLNLAAMEKRNHAQLITVAAFELGYRPNPANLVGTVYAVLSDPSLMQYRIDGPLFADLIHKAVSEWRGAIDNHEDRVFAGRCNACNQQMFARPNSEKFRCATRGCEAEYATADQLRYVLDQIRETLWPIEMIRQFAKNQLDVKVNNATVRSWRRRDQLVARGVDIDGQETYRVGDYLDLAQSMKPRATEDRASA